MATTTDTAPAELILDRYCEPDEYDTPTGLVQVLAELATTNFAPLIPHRATLENALAGAVAAWLARPDVVLVTDRDHVDAVCLVCGGGVGFWDDHVGRAVGSVDYHTDGADVICVHCDR